MKNRARQYISQVKWQNAKSYENTAPHEYTVRKWSPQLDDEFVWFALYIREVGYPEKFGKTTYRYLFIDGYRYWTMGAPIGITIIINRCSSTEDHGTQQDLK